MTDRLRPDPTGIGEQMYGWIADLFPMKRSLSGPGVRKTLTYMKGLLPDLECHEIASGSKVFDWTVPDEWTLRDAYIENESGERVVDLADHGLHVLGYSEPVDQWMDLDELQQHLYSLPDQPEAIPYVTSYYERRWGFCLSQRQRDALVPGKYRAVVDADLQPGVINYADLVLPGSEDREIIFSTYLCHPQMANNELSGVAVAMALARWLAGRDRRFTYRFIFVPETIGAIIYLNRHLEHLKQKVHAGFVVTCVGDDRTYSFMPSRVGGTVADQVALSVLEAFVPKFDRYSFLERGSDERQFCSPMVDLPVVSIMRSKYGRYPEYHTSLDNLDFVTPSGLEGAYSVLQACVRALEANAIYEPVFPCEPQLGKRGLYPTLSTKESRQKVRAMMNFLAYCDGQTSLFGISEIIGETIERCTELAHSLSEAGVIRLKSKV
jgi:aminopeptidase-like protein